MNVRAIVVGRGRERGEGLGGGGLTNIGTRVPLDEILELVQLAIEERGRRHLAGILRLLGTWYPTNTPYSTLQYKIYKKSETPKTIKV